MKVAEKGIELDRESCTGRRKMNEEEREKQERNNGTETSGWDAKQRGKGNDERTESRSMDQIRRGKANR